MAEGMNTYQLAGLVGTATSQVLQAGGMYAQGQMSSASLSMQAGATASSGILQSADIMAKSELQTLLREQEQADLQYQANSIQIDKVLLGAKADFLTSQTEEQANQMLRAMNDEHAGIVMAATAQGRTGATIDNIIRQKQYKVDKDMSQARVSGAMARSNIEAQKAKLESQSEIAKLAIKSSKDTSVLEQKIAKSTSEYQAKSSAISAQALRAQSKAAGRIATSGAIAGIAGTALMGGIALG